MDSRKAPSSPLVSVVVITYNQAPYIARTLDSVLAQRCSFAFEIVLGDDASTDGTADICRQYAERYPDIVRFHAADVNRGVVGNYFDCLGRARGKYLADCGGDDFWIDPLKLQRQVDLMEAHPEVALCHTNWNYYDEASGSVTRSDICHPQLRQLRRHISAPGEMLLPVLRSAGSIPIHSCTWLVRRDALMPLIEADPDLFLDPANGCEDRPIAASLAANYAVAYIDDVTLNYSVGKPSVTSVHNYSRTFAFYLATTRLTRRLELKYLAGRAPAETAGGEGRFVGEVAREEGIREGSGFGGGDDERADGEGRLREFYISRVKYLVALAFAARRRDLMDAARDLAAELHITLPASTRLKYLLANPITWPLAARLLAPR